jgi:hypothetical protein
VGTYKISDVAAEFNRVVLNEEAVGLIPENQSNVPYAALDRVVRKEEPVMVAKTVSPEIKVQPRKEAPKKVFKPVVVPVRQEKPKIREVKKEVKKPFIKFEKKVEPVQNQLKEFVAGILEDDDLR